MQEIKHLVSPKHSSNVDHANPTLITSQSQTLTASLLTAKLRAFFSFSQSTLACAAALMSVTG